MVAPLAATAAFWALNVIAGTIERRSLPLGGDPNALLGTLFLYLLVGLPVAYLATVVVAYPVFLLLKRCDRLTKRAILLASAVVGAAVVTTPAVIGAAQGRFEVQALFIGIAFGIPAGIVGGVVFNRLFPFQTAH